MQTQKERGKRSPGINPVIYVWECKALTSSNWSNCNNRSGPPWKIWQLFIGAAVIEGLGTWWYFYTQIMTAGTRIPQIPPSIKNTGQAQYTHLHSHWEDLRGAVQQRITSIPILERKPENSYITPLWEKKKKVFFHDLIPNNYVKLRAVETMNLECWVLISWINLICPLVCHEFRYREAKSPEHSPWRKEDYIEFCQH